MIQLSELDDAIIRRIKWLVLHEHRSFTYVDLLEFTSHGERYSLKHGTIRNKLSELTKRGVIELYCRSGLAFYTLRGVRLGQRKKCNHMRVSHLDLYNLLLDLPLGQRAVHDIRLQFRAPAIWNVISRDANTINPYSKDIALPEWRFEGITVKVTIHRSNVVTIIVACSSTPLSLDFDGILRMSNCLSLVQERIQRYVDECCTLLQQFKQVDSFKIVPNHMNWIVTMWHFGADALTEYGGKTFCLSWKIAEGVLIRAYAKKNTGKKLRIRLEKQECPRKPLAEAIEEKLLNV